MIRQVLLVAAVLAGGGVEGLAQTVIVVRHAERADSATGGQTMMAADPELSEAGRTRAASLAGMLRDAGVTAIYVTEFRRTQQTAEPLARALGIPTTTVAARNTAGLLDALKTSEGTVLVVGHSNTVPEIVKGLGVVQTLSIADDEFDNLLVVVPGPEPRLLRLRYR